MDFSPVSEIFTYQDEMIKHLPAVKQPIVLADACPNGIIPISNAFALDWKVAWIFWTRCQMGTDTLLIQMAITEIYARKRYNFA